MTIVGPGTMALATSASAVAPTEGGGLLRAEGLTVMQDRRPIVNRIDLSFHPGTVTALIGPTGCGKTTFLRSLNRLNDWQLGLTVEGQVWLDGVDIYAPGTDILSIRRRIGMVLEGTAPFPKSIFDNVAYGPRVAGVKDPDILQNLVQRALERAALWSEVGQRLDQSALGLTSGQQQRLCIARMLATDPEVLLLDEPASVLDPASTAAIEDVIFELKRSFTIVMVTRHMQQAARVSDQTAFFCDGELVECGNTNELFTRPRQARTEQFITGRFG